jgi:hypothetical protein
MRTRIIVRTKLVSKEGIARGVETRGLIEKDGNIDPVRAYVV